MTLLLSPLLIQRVRLRLARGREAKYMGHLQQIDCIRHMLKESAWPVALTQGKKPKVKASFGPAISVGYESQAEYVDVELKQRLDLTEAEEGLRPHLRPGFSFIEVKSIPRFFPSLEASLNMGAYEIQSTRLQDSHDRWNKFWKEKDFFVVKKKSDSEIWIDARPLVRSWNLNGDKLSLEIRFGPGRTLKPERIVQAVCGLTDEEADASRPDSRIKVNRLNFYFEKRDGELIEP